VKTELTETVKMVIGSAPGQPKLLSQKFDGDWQYRTSSRTAVAQNVSRQHPPTALVESQLKRYRLAAVMLRK
jgi:hypothetical protein